MSILPKFIIIWTLECLLSFPSSTQCLLASHSEWLVSVKTSLPLNQHGCLATTQGPNLEEETKVRPVSPTFP